MTLLQADDLTLTLRTSAERVAVLRHISLSLAAGRVLGLVGESGAGKSMIGRVISGLLPSGFEVTAGQLRFDGQDLLNRPDRRALLGRDIAFIPQEPMTALNPVQSIGHQIIEHLARLDIPDRRRAASLVTTPSAPPASVRRRRNRGCHQARPPQC